MFERFLADGRERMMRRMRREEEGRGSRGKDRGD